MVHPGGCTRSRLALWAVAEATLSTLVLAIISQTVKQQFRCYLGEEWCIREDSNLRPLGS